MAFRLRHRHACGNREPGAGALSVARVKIVLPAAPGSTTDTLARLVADQLARNGASRSSSRTSPAEHEYRRRKRGARGARRLHTAGQRRPRRWRSTICFITTSDTIRRNSSRSRCWPRLQTCWRCGKNFPARSLKELIAYGKANPGKLTFASQGVGSTAHLSAAQLEVLGGIKMVHVPYRGAQPALTDVVSGNVDMFFDTLATSVPLYRGDKMKLLGVASANARARCRRSRRSPKPACRASARSPGSPWRPARQCPPRSRKRSTATRSKFCEKPQVAEKPARALARPDGRHHRGRRKILRRRDAMWGKVIKEAHITLE